MCLAKRGFQTDLRDPHREEDSAVLLTVNYFYFYLGLDAGERGEIEERKGTREQGGYCLCY